jgi:hypothetical protein
VANNHRSSHLNKKSDLWLRNTKKILNFTKTKMKNMFKRSIFCSAVRMILVLKMRFSNIKNKNNRGRFNTKFNSISLWRVHWRPFKTIMIFWFNKTNKLSTKTKIYRKSVIFWLILTFNINKKSDNCKSKLMNMIKIVKTTITKSKTIKKNCMAKIK